MAVFIKQSGHYADFFIQEEQISAGCFGVVVKCMHNLERKVYAVKKTQYVLSSNSEAAALNEVKIHSQLDHPSIVRYYHSWTEVDRSPSKIYSDDIPRGIVYIKMELCSRSLEDLLESCKEDGLSTRDSWDFFHQIVEGLHHLHNRDIIHADLKTGNILIGTDGRIRIADFGLSKELHPDTVPEIMTKGLLGTYSDTYSLGLLLVELVFPFKFKYQRNEIFMKLKAHGISSWGDGILYRMLDPSPSLRPSMSHVLSISDEAGQDHCNMLRSRVVGLLPSISAGYN